MILYHSVTIYQVLEAIVHRERVHAGEHCVLLLADFSAKKYQDYRDLEAFFDEVLLFPYRSISNDPDTILEDTENAYRSSVPYGITEFEHIYVASAFYYFSLYLIANSVSFHMFEDGGGILSKPKVLYETIRDVTPVMADIAQTYGLLDGNNEYIRDIICNFSAQSFLSDDPKWKHFDPTSEIVHLRPETIRDIKSFFRLETIRDIPENAVLIFTQQFSNLYTTTMEEQIAIYQVCADFFLRDRFLIFKPHPEDTVDYARFFPEARTIRGRFPAELMPLLLDQVPDTSFTVFSSSVRNLRSMFRKNIVCGFDFPTTFRAIERYYFAVKLLSELEEGNSCPVHTFGVDVNLLETLAEHSLNISLPFVHETVLKKKTARRQVWLIDDCTFQSDYFRTKEKELSFPYRRVKVKGVEPPEPDAACISAAESPEQSKSQADSLSVHAFLDACGEGDLVIFLDSRNDHCFYDEKNIERFQRMILLRVKHRRLREENVFFPDRDLTIYVYTQDAGIREKAMQFHDAIVLENTGLAAEIQTSEQASGDDTACRQIPVGEPAPETNIGMEEYLDLAMDLNDMSMKAFLRDKINMFLRPGLREFMRRPALVPASSSDEQIRQFLRTCRKAVGKRNTCSGEGFRIYTDNGTDLVGQIRSDGVDILEPYICQLSAYQAIYPHSLSTIRIHTVRSGGDVRIFLPLALSVGDSGAVTDKSAATARYRILLSEDGSILRAFRQDPGGHWQCADRHHDTGYLFRQGRKLPGIPACVECCRKAALFIPEMRYIGWDFAVTDQGPVIVEANNISGFVHSLQQAKACITGAGIRTEVEELFAFGMENVRYNTETVFVSEPLIGVEASLPDSRGLYLILLQSVLHRHGVEFYDRAFITPRHAVKKHCSIRYLAEDNIILLKTEQNTKRIPQPDVGKLGLLPYGEDQDRPHVSEEDFFALDQLAAQEAARIYRALTSDINAKIQVTIQPPHSEEHEVFRAMGVLNSYVYFKKERDMRILGVIPSRLGSSRLYEKPLADICGKPMVVRVYEQVKKTRNIDDIIVATDSDKIVAVCEEYGINSIMTSADHVTPTSRIYEVSTKLDYDYYAFISGDEPLIDPESIDLVASEAKKGGADAFNAMIEIERAPDVIDFSNIKVVTNTEGFLLYASRSPLPYPKGGLDFVYTKFVGIGVFSKHALQVFNDTPRSKLEQIEECDLLRFIEKGIRVKMIKVMCESLSVDTSKDLEYARLMYSNI